MRYSSGYIQYLSVDTRKKLFAMKNGNGTLWCCFVFEPSMICMAFHGIRYYCAPPTNCLLSKKLKRKGFTHRDISYWEVRIEKKKKEKKCIRSSRLIPILRISSGLHFITQRRIRLIITLVIPFKGMPEETFRGNFLSKMQCINIIIWKYFITLFY